MSDLPIIKTTNGVYWLTRESELHGTYIIEDGTFYHVNGELHRENGPACEWRNGNKHWYYHGDRHRLDGPAIENISGNYLYDKEYFINGILFGEEEYWKAAYIINNNLEDYK